MIRRTHGGARKGAGRPSGTTDTKPRKPRTEGGRHKRQVVLDDETLAIWDSLEGDRSAWVRAAMVERLVRDSAASARED